MYGLTELFKPISTYWNQPKTQLHDEWINAIILNRHVSRGIGYLHTFILGTWSDTHASSLITSCMDLVSGDKTKTKLQTKPKQNQTALYKMLLYTYNTFKSNSAFIYNTKLLLTLLS